MNGFVCQLFVLTFSLTQESPQFDALMAYLQRAQLEIRQIRCGEQLSRSQDHSSHSGSTRDVHSIGCLSTDEDSTGNSTGTTVVAMFLGEFDSWCESGTS